MKGQTSLFQGLSFSHRSTRIMFGTLFYLQSSGLHYCFLYYLSNLFFLKPTGGVE
jgi:hypothetical protein